MGFNFDDYEVMGAAPQDAQQEPQPLQDFSFDRYDPKPQEIPVDSETGFWDTVVEAIPNFVQGELDLGKNIATAGFSGFTDTIQNLPSAVAEVSSQNLKYLNKFAHDHPKLTHFVPVLGPLANAMARSPEDAIATGIDTTFKPATDAGDFIYDWFEKQKQINPELYSQTEGFEDKSMYNPTRFIPEGMRSVGAILPYGVLGPLSGDATAVGFYNVTAQDAYHKAEKEHPEWDDGRKFAYSNVQGGIEGLLEFLKVDRLLAPAFRLLPKKVAGDIIKEAAGKGIKGIYAGTKKVIKGVLKTIAPEVGMETFQNHTEKWNDFLHFGYWTDYEGKRREDYPKLSEEVKMMPTVAVMTVVLGTAPHLGNITERKKISAALEGTDVDQKDRKDAVMKIYGAVKDQDKELADMWLATTAENVAKNKPVAVVSDNEVKKQYEMAKKRRSFPATDILDLAHSVRADLLSKDKLNDSEVKLAAVLENSDPHEISLALGVSVDSRSKAQREIDQDLLVSALSEAEDQDAKDKLLQAAYPTDAEAITNKVDGQEMPDLASLVSEDTPFTAEEKIYPAATGKDQQPAPAYQGPVSKEDADIFAEEIAYENYNPEVPSAGKELKPSTPAESAETFKNTPPNEGAERLADERIDMETASETARANAFAAAAELAKKEEELSTALNIRALPEEVDKLRSEAGKETDTGKRREIKKKIAEREAELDTVPLEEFASDVSAWVLAEIQRAAIQRAAFNRTIISINMAREIGLNIESVLKNGSPADIAIAKKFKSAFNGKESPYDFAKKHGFKSLSDMLTAWDSEALSIRLLAERKTKEALLKMAVVHSRLKAQSFDDRIKAEYALRAAKRSGVNIRGLGVIEEGDTFKISEVAPDELNQIPEELRDAVYLMKEQVANGDKGGVSFNEHGDATNNPSTFPDWFKQKQDGDLAGKWSVKEFDNIVNKLENNLSMTAKQSVRADDLLKAAQYVRDTDQSIAYGPIMQEYEADGYTFVGGKNIEAGDIDVGSWIVANFGTGLREYEVVSFDFAGVVFRSKPGVEESIMPGDRVEVDMIKAPGEERRSGQGESDKHGITIKDERNKGLFRLWDVSGLRDRTAKVIPQEGATLLYYDNLLGDYGITNFSTARLIASELDKKKIPYVIERGDGGNMGGINALYKTHAAADVEIRKVWGDIFATKIREYGGIIGRDQGDEFLVIWPNFTVEEAESVRAEIEKEIRAKRDELGLGEIFHEKKGLPTGALHMNYGMVQRGDGAYDAEEELADKLQEAQKEEEIVEIADQRGYTYNKKAKIYEKNIEEGAQDEQPSMESETRPASGSGVEGEVGISGEVGGQEAPGISTENIEEAGQTNSKGSEPEITLEEAIAIEQDAGKVSASSLVGAKDVGDINSQLDRIFGTEKELDQMEKDGVMSGDQLDMADELRADIEYAARNRYEGEVYELLSTLRKSKILPEDRGSSYTVSRGGAKGRDVQPSAKVQAQKEGTVTKRETKPVAKKEKVKRPKGYGKNNKVFTKSAADKARTLLKSKLNQLNAGIDPELMQAGIMLAGYHVESGARTFGDYSKSMVEDIGSKIKPFLKSFYNAVRDWPGFDAKGMDSYEGVANYKEPNAKVKTETKGASETLKKKGFFRTPGGIGYKIQSIHIDGRGDSFYYTKTENGVKTEVGPGYPAMWTIDKAISKVVSEIEQAGGTEDAVDRTESSKTPLFDVVGKTKGSGKGSLENVETGDGKRTPEPKRPRSKNAKSGGKDVKGDIHVDGQGDAVSRGGVDDASEVHTPEAGSGSDRGNGTRVNFKITDDLKLGKGSEKVKFEDNLAAIKVLKEIGTGNATPEEQAILARYVGWGGLANAFRNGMTGKVAKGWEERVAAVESILTGEELAVARNSTINANYTSHEVVKGMWGIATRLGFSGGNVLEPSMGIGNFFGLNSTPSNMLGVEYDPITAKIASKLYPQSAVIHNGFEKVPLPSNSFDLAIGNPPFGKEKLTFKYSPELNGKSIHNQFFLASLAALKPGGIQVMVVSRYLLDAKDSSARLALAEKGKLIGAIRLPDNAFKENARIEVVTDIIILQKYNDGEETNTNQRWVNTTEIADPLGGDNITVNQYFADNPQNILGTLERSGSMQQGNDVTVRAGAEINVGAGIELIAESLPSNIAPEIGQDVADNFDSMVKAIELGDIEAGDITFDEGGALTQIINKETPSGDLVSHRRELMAESPWHKSLTLGVDGRWSELIPKLGEDGKKVKTKKGKALRNVYERKYYTEAEIPASKRLGKKNLATLKGIVELRDLVKRQLSLEINKDAGVDEIEQHRAKLSRAYRKFIKDNGPTNSVANKRIARTMNDIALFLSLEEKYKAPITAAIAKRTGKKVSPAIVRKATILSERVQFPYKKKTSAATTEDALAITLAEGGKVDLSRLEELLGMPEQKVLAELNEEKRLIFFDPRLQGWVPANEYLGGNVVQKLAEAKDSDLAVNIEELEKIQPEPWTAEQVTATMGASWIPAHVYKEFIQTFADGVSVTFSAATNSFNVQSSNSPEWSTPDVTTQKLVSSILNSRVIKIRYKDEDGRTHIDSEATEGATAMAEDLKELFDDWVYRDSTRRAELVGIFNKKNNTVVNKQWDGGHLVFPGMTPNITLRRHQKNAVWRGIVDNAVLFDHAVGAGKTYTAIARAMERKRMGMSNKPMIVVPNHIVEQFASDVYKLYPGAKLLAAGKEDLSPSQRRQLFAKAATGNWDIIIIPHSSFKFIGISPETESRYLLEELEVAKEAIKEAEQKAQEDGYDGWRKPVTVKDAERLRDKITKRLGALKNKNGDKDTLLTFEQIGVDDLTVDESHSFKNLFYNSNLDVRGMNPKEGSNMAYDLWLKTRVISEMSGSLAFMTGTPISNSAVEMYGLMRYLAADKLKELDLEHFDAWRSQFTTVTTKFEPTDSGAGLKEVSRIGRDWSNMRALMNLYYSFSDSVGNDDIIKWFEEDTGGKFPIPDVRGGGRQAINVSPTDAQRTVITKIVDGFEGLDGITDVKQRNAERLRLMDKARKVSLDVRAVDPINPSDEKGGKLDVLSKEVAKIYRRTTEDKGTQLIFLDRGVPKAKGDADKIKKYDALVRKVEEAERSGVDHSKLINELDKYNAAEIEELRAAQSSNWSAYQQVKDNLIALGIPEAEIRFIQEANTDAQKTELFDEVNSGQVRILIGSTPRMGAGTNVQERLVALHHGDVTWKPSDIEQREGRIIRQGNSLLEKYGDDFKVDILAYTTDTTVDAKLWSLNSTKLKMINGIRNYKGDFNMEFEDEDSVGMAEIAAIASGEPLQLERVQLAAEIDRLKRQKKAHARKVWGAKDELENIERTIKTPIAAYEIAESKLVTKDDATKDRKVTVNGKVYKFEDLSKVYSDIGDIPKPFKAEIDGEEYTAKAKAELAIQNKLGDGTVFDAEFNGGHFVTRKAARAKIVEAANDALDRSPNGELNDYPLGTINMFGIPTKISVDAGGDSVSFYFDYAEGGTKVISTGFDAKLNIGKVHTAMPGLFRSTEKAVSEIAGITERRKETIKAAEKTKPELEKVIESPFKKEEELTSKQGRLGEVENALAGSGKKLLSVGDGSAGSTVTAVESRVNSLLGKKARTTMKVEVVQSVNDLAGIISIGHDTIYSADGEIEGLYDPATGKIIIVADNVGVDRVWPVLLHEVVHGIRAKSGWTGVFGSKSKSIMAEIEAKIKSGDKAWKDARLKAIDAGTAESDLLEETITYFLAENTNKKQGLWNKIVSAIRAWAVNIGLTQKITDADIQALAERAVVNTGRNGRESGVPAPLLPAMRSQQQLWHSRIRRIIQDKFPKKASPSELTKTIESWKKKGTIPKPVQEELEWSGLEDWIKEQKGKINKQEILDFIAANNVQVEEVLLGVPVVFNNEDRLRLEYLVKKPIGVFVWGGEGFMGGTSLSREEEVELLDLQNRKENILTDDKKTNFSDYQTPGGDNYRELLITFPTDPDIEPSLTSSVESLGYTLVERHHEIGDSLEVRKGHVVVAEGGVYDIKDWLYQEGYAQPKPKQYTSPHFDEKNILAHVRFNERTGPDGKKVLFIEEVQSDWHQAGRNKGYKGDPPLTKQYGVSIGGVEPNIDGGMVPDAPFKKTWPLLAMKRMIRYAAENGFDKVAWTTGAQQADRYDLSKQVNKLSALKARDGKNYQLVIEGTDGIELTGYRGSGKKVTPQKMEETVGKEAAKKLIDGANKKAENKEYQDYDWYNMSGVDLKVGGKGMKAFYDKMLPSTVNKFVKKFGSKTGVTEINTGKKVAKVHSIDVTQKMKESALAHGMPLFAKTPATPTQIKSAISNTGEFSATNPDIRFSRKPRKRLDTMHPDKMRDLIDVLDDNAADVVEKQRALAKYILKLPISERGRRNIIAAITKLGKPKTLATRRKYFADAIQIIDSKIENVAKGKEISRIEKIFDKATPDKKGGKPKGKMHPDAHKYIAEAERIYWLHPAHALDELEALAEEIGNEQNELPEDKQRQFYMLNVYPSLKGRTSAEIKEAADELERVMKDGRTLRELQETARKERMKGVRDETIKTFTGGRDLFAQKDTNRLNAGKWWTRFKSGLAGFDDNHQSFEWLLDKFSQTGAALGGVSKYFSDLAFTATENANADMSQFANVVHDAASNIFGAEKLNSKLNENTLVLEETGVKLNGREIPLSKNQAYKLWQWLESPSLQADMESHGYDSTVKKQLEKFMGADIKAWAQWQLDTFYPQFRDEYANPAYRERFFVDMANIEGYSPMVRDRGGAASEDDLLLQEKTYFASELAGSLKSRVANKFPPKVVDGDAVLMNHISQMTHFVNWTKPIQEMRSVLTSDSVLEAVEVFYGAEAKNVLKNFVNVFARGGIDRASNIAWLDKIRSNTIVSMIGANPTVLMKQIASFPAYMMDMPVTDFFKGVLKFAGQPNKYKERVHKLINNKYLENRYRLGHERDIVAALSRNVPQAISGKTTLQDMMMLPTKLGDGGAIVLGGWAYFEHRFNHYKKTMSVEKAEDKALFDFAKVTNRNQQSGNLMEMGGFQRGGTMHKLMTMYMTSQQQYYRNVAGGYRNLYRGRGSKAENIKRIAVSQFILPMLFQLIASGFRWDSEDQARAVLIGPLNGLFLARDGIEALVRGITGGKRYSSSGRSPVFSIYDTVGDVGGHALKMVKDMSIDNLLPLLDDGAEIAATVAGVPYRPLKKIVTGVTAATTGKTKYPIRRSLGFSPYALKDKKRSKPKNSKVKYRPKVRKIGREL